jgi:protein-S-isoprenylcysteine O-methyltransferase Ste14
MAPPSWLNQRIAPEPTEMLRALAYIWAIFGAYWIIFAPAVHSESAVSRRFQRLQLIFLGVTFALLLWKAQVIRPIWLMVVGLAWSGLGLHWVAPRKAARSGEYQFYRLLRLLIGTVTFTLLFWRETGAGILGSRFMPQGNSVAAGFVVALIGLAIAAWARIHLGQYWSDKVVIQANHNLIRSGPYARMRHPIYSGVLLGIAGTAMVVGEWRGILAFLIMLANYTIKARREDKILAERFGQEFQDYQTHAGLLLPRFNRNLDS